MKLSVDNITPVTMVVNEEYWIYNTLYWPLKIFPKVIMLDTGSTDNTIKIASRVSEDVRGNLVVHCENYGGDANKIGNGRNVLREMVGTHWMFLIDGDEIWDEPQLMRLLEKEVPNNIQVCMAGSRNVEDVDGKLMQRTHDTANKDILFAPDVRWTKVDYPFEGYGLGDNLPMEVVQYFDAADVFLWHVRHTLRSGKNSEAFFRDNKFRYFPYDKGHEELSADWPGSELVNCNPYR
jgi:glycosyltransferase involved in cell wall biosynthesis